MRYISEAAERIDEQLDAGEDGKKKKNTSFTVPHYSELCVELSSSPS